MKTGYKEMLRDRVPKTADLALKWCKVKGKWIDHVYDHFIRVAADKKLRYELTRTMLGIGKNHRGFNFQYTIDWGILTPEENKLWNKVAAWQHWFSKNLLYIEDDYRHAIRMNRLDSFEVDFIKAYLSDWLPKKDDPNYERRLRYVDCFSTFVTNYLEKEFNTYVLCIFHKTNPRL